MYNLRDTIKIITRISEGSRSEVYLASDARGELVIYKRILTLVREKAAIENEVFLDKS